MMSGLKRFQQTWLIITALALLTCFLVFRRQPNAPNVSDTSRGPSFEFRIVKPRLARPLFGILPTQLEEKLEAGGERRSDHTSHPAAGDPGYLRTTTRTGSDKQDGSFLIELTRCTASLAGDH